MCRLAGPAESCKTFRYAVGGLPLRTHVRARAMACLPYHLSARQPHSQRPDRRSRWHLTGKEDSILELLSLHKGRILTKEMFLNYVYDG
jgi:DNA-binding response OmpR family regulator